MRWSICSTIAAELVVEELSPDVLLPELPLELLLPPPCTALWTAVWKELSSVALIEPSPLASIAWNNWDSPLVELPVEPSELELAVAGVFSSRASGSVESVTSPVSLESLESDALLDSVFWWPPCPWCPCAAWVPANWAVDIGTLKLEGVVEPVLLVVDEVESVLDDVLDGEVLDELSAKGVALADAMLACCCCLCASACSICCKASLEELLDETFMVQSFLNDG